MVEGGDPAMCPTSTILRLAPAVQAVPVVEGMDTFPISIFRRRALVAQAEEGVHTFPISITLRRALVAQAEEDTHTFPISTCRHRAQRRAHPRLRVTLPEHIHTISADGQSRPSPACVQSS